MTVAAVPVAAGVLSVGKEVDMTRMFDMVDDTSVVAATQLIRDDDEIGDQTRNDDALHTAGDDVAAVMPMVVHDGNGNVRLGPTNERNRVIAVAIDIALEARPKNTRTQG